MRDAREKLRLTQTQFGELGGVKRVSQHLYEAGDRVPDVNYLIRLKDHGVDVSHLLGVGGHRNGSANYADAHIYLSVFRAVDEFARDATGAPFSSAERERFFPSCVPRSRKPIRHRLRPSYKTVWRVS